MHTPRNGKLLMHWSCDVQNVQRSNDDEYPLTLRLSWDGWETFREKFQRPRGFASSDASTPMRDWFLTFTSKCATCRHISGKHGGGPISFPTCRLDYRSSSFKKHKVDYQSYPGYIVHHDHRSNSLHHVNYGGINWIYLLLFTSMVIVLQSQPTSAILIKLR